MVRVVPAAVTPPAPEVTCGSRLRVMGRPGKGLVTSVATSTLTGEPSETRVVGAAVMRGRVEATTRRGRVAVTAALVPSSTRTSSEPAVPGTASSAALTDRVEPDTEVLKPSGAAPAVKTRGSESASRVMAARSAVTAGSPGATVTSVGVITGGVFVVETTRTGRVIVELSASEPVPSATASVSEVWPVNPAAGVTDRLRPESPAWAESSPVPALSVAASATTGVVPARVRT